MTTTVTKWTPLFPELGLFDRPLRRMLNGFVPGMLPAADVYETPTELVVELEVPGFEEKQLGIEVSDHTLTISGDRKLITEETDKSFIIQERLENTFTRRSSSRPRPTRSASRPCSPRVCWRCIRRSSQRCLLTRSRSRCRPARV
jgi:hypothetical protein